MRPKPPDDRGFAERVGRAYRGVPIEAAEARRRLDERLRHEGRPGPAPWRGSWWLGRASFRARPLVLAGVTLALIAASVTVGALAGRSRPAPGPNASGTATAGAATSLGRAASEPRATFAIVAPGVSRVALVGDFNGWDPEATPLRRAALGDLWIADVAMPTGVHLYAFVLDGTRWVPDPSAPLAPAGAFDGRASVVVVPHASAL